MAPARMMQFAEKHILCCETCRHDPELAEDIEKIRAFVLPESKMPKEDDDESEATPEISPYDEEEENEKDEDDLDEDLDEDLDGDLEDDDL